MDQDLFHRARASVALSHYVDRLALWNRTINLIGSSTLQNIWDRHIYDSIQLIPYLPLASGISFIDVGSGAGLPGIPLAIMTGLPVHLVERDQRKAAFLKNVSRETCPSATVMVRDVKDCQIDDFVPGKKVFVARGWAPFEKILELLSHLWMIDSEGFFLKGQNWHKELKAAERHWDVDVNIYPSQTSPEGRILGIKSLRRRDG